VPCPANWPLQGPECCSEAGFWEQGGGGGGVGGRGARGSLGLRGGGLGGEEEEEEGLVLVSQQIAQNKEGGGHTLGVPL